MTDDRSLDGLVSRRTLLAGSGAAALLLGAGGLLTACGGSSKSPTASKSPTPAGSRSSGALASPSGSIKPGAALQGIITQQIPTSLDPLTNQATTSAWNSAPAHDWLEYYDSKNVLYASLASKVTQVDSTHIQYELRPGVVFHNGEAVTAQAVADLFAWVQDKTNGAWLQPQFVGVTTKVVSATTLIVALPAPNVSFRGVMARLPIVPVSAAKQQALHPIGCGPYLFDNWVQGSDVSYKLNPAASNSSQLPATIRINHFPSDATGTQNFQSGGSDFCFPAALAQAGTLRSGASAGGYDFAPLEQGVAYLFLNNKKGPFANPQVRKAVRLAINRDLLVSSAFNGVGRPYFALLPPDSPYFSSDLNYSRDVSQAKSILKSANAGNITATIVTLNVGYFQTLATLLKANLADIGINVTVQIQDTASVIKRGLTTKDFDLLVLADALEPDPATLLNYYVASDGPRNGSQYSNPKVDQLLKSAGGETDEATRKSDLQQAMKTVFIDDTGIIPLCAEALPALQRHSNFVPSVAASGGIAYWRWQDARVYA